MSLPLEKQVCGLELAQKLKELGVEQESMFYWSHGFNCQKMDDFWELLFIESERLKYGDKISAFTVAELGEILPSGFKVCKTGTLKYLGSQCIEQGEWEDLPETLSQLEADARAKMLIYLIEKGLYEPQPTKKD